MKIYEITYVQNTEKLIVACAEYSLINITKTIEGNGGKIIAIKLKKSLNKNAKHPRIMEKKKYYLAKYNSYYKKQKKGKISNEMFLKIKEKLKTINDENITIKEFKDKFEQFLKENNL